ncbi:MAG: macro domain-containing protein [Lachnospiraceae bacterium]|nr:macro domain-containing protein [Lachnospiraceae bacterium]
MNKEERMSGNLELEYIGLRKVICKGDKTIEKELVKIPVIKGDIALAEVDIIVNAANGCGWMGGKRCQSELHKGVAEHINYYTKGTVEQEARKAARKVPYISSWIFGHKAGDFFVTGSGGLKCKKIVHAVTMRYPASHSKTETVTEVLRKIFEFCSEEGYKSIALPALGCGNGGIDRGKFREVFLDEAQHFPELDIRYYTL